MKRVASFMLAVVMACTMLISPAFTADSAGQFDKYLVADQPSSGTEASYQ